MKWTTVAALSLLLISSVAAVEEDVELLMRMRSQSRDSVIRLTEDLYKLYFAAPTRPYSAIVFFSSQEVAQQNPTLQLDALRAEYSLAAKAFAAGPDNDKIFFFEASLEDARGLFAVLQVASLPCVLRIAPTQSMRNPPVELLRADKMLPDTVDMKKYPWPAEQFIERMGQGLKAAEVVRPSLYNSPMFPLMVGGLLVLLAVVGYQVYMLDLLRHPAIWATLSLMVFWFSASGGMFNIIRGMPFFIRGRDGRLQFFLMNRQGQLGAEGFSLGTLYLLCSGSLAALTYLAPRIPNKSARDSTSWFLAIVACSTIYYTFKLWMQKTGYQHVFYI